MEPEGVYRVFKRSVELHNFQYTEYYGDGDSKSFTKEKDAYQASGINVPKKSALVMCRKGWAQHFVSWNVKTQAWEKKAS